MLTTIAAQVVYNDLCKCKDYDYEHDTKQSNVDTKQSNVDTKQSNVDTKQSNVDTKHISKNDNNGEKINSQLLNKHNLLYNKNVMECGLKGFIEYHKSVVYFIQNNIY